MLNLCINDLKAKDNHCSSLALFHLLISLFTVTD